MVECFSASRSRVVRHTSGVIIGYIFRNDISRKSQSQLTRCGHLSKPSQRWTWQGIPRNQSWAWPCRKVLSSDSQQKKPREWLWVCSLLEVTWLVLKSNTIYYSLFFYGDRIILYCERPNPKYSLFIFFFKPLFIIHIPLPPPTSTWRLPTMLYNFVRNVSTNISTLGQRAHHSLWELSSLFIVYNFMISWLNPLLGYLFYFLLRDNTHTL